MKFTRSAPTGARNLRLVPVTSAMPLPGLLAQLTAEARPRLTWYSDAERVELSGQVLDNWVTKVSNFLVEEYEAGPGTRVHLDLPLHWRSVVWAFAVWRVGACLAPAPTGRIHLVVTDRPTAPRGSAVVALGLPALARSFDGDLPDGVVDATGAVMGYGDLLTWMPEPDPLASAVDLPGRSVMHRALGAWAERVLARSGASSPGGRVLVESTDLRRDLVEGLGIVLAVYAANGSVVLRCAGSADDAARRRLIETERVTDVVTLPPA